MTFPGLLRFYSGELSSIGLYKDLGTGFNREKKTNKKSANSWIF